MSEAPPFLERSVCAPVRRNPYWLIARRTNHRLEVLTSRLADGRRVLPIFSFEEEAALYLRRGILGSWRLWRTETGELVSLLYGLCRGVELVALDPVSDVETDVVNGLVSLERERFAHVLLHRKTSARLSLSTPQATSTLGGRRSASARTKDAVS